MNSGDVNIVIESSLWIIVSIIFGIITLFFVNKYRKMDKEAKPFILGLIFFIGTFMIARTIETYRRYFYSGNYHDIVESGFRIFGTNLILRLLYYIIAWGGISVFYLVFEKYIMNRKTKYILTVCTILEGTFSCLLYFTHNELWNFMVVTILFFGVAFIPLILFIYLSIKAVYRSNRIAWILNTIGFIFFVLGVMADLPEAYTFVQNIPISEELIRYFNPIAMSIGAILMGTGFWIMYKST